MSDWQIVATILGVSVASLVAYFIGYKHGLDDGAEACREAVQFCVDTPSQE